MSEFRVVTEGELCPVLAVLNSLDWPVPFESFPEVFLALGWEKQRRKGGRTSLPVSLPVVSVGSLHDEIAELDFRISDTLPGTSAENRRIVREAFPGAVEIVSACLGAAPDGNPWVAPGVRWELAGGRRINLLCGEDAIILQYWSKRLADVERDERRLGVDPRHNLDDRG